MFLRRLIAGALACVASTSASALEQVHEERSLYRNIFVFDDDGERCMRFRRLYGELRQSCIDQKNPDRLVFDYAKLVLGALYLRPNPASALIIGLGGGVLPTTLSKILPQMKMDVVEIDPAVVRVARQYFDFKPGASTRVFEEDGRVYVKRALRAGQKYDLVILDAFDHEYIPEHMLTREFLTEVKGILSPQGVLAANTFSLRNLYDSESVTYAAVYGEFYNLKRANRLVLASPAGLPSREMLERNARALQPKLARFGVEPDWLLPIFSSKPDWKTDAPVLTDKFSPSNLLNAN